MPAAPVDDGGAAHLRGAHLPGITLPSTLGGEVNLSTRPGAAIVYVYPWTGRPGLPDPPGWDDVAGAHGSTPETVSFRDRYASFQSLAVSQRYCSVSLGGKQQRHIDVDAHLKQLANRFRAFDRAGDFDHHVRAVDRRPQPFGFDDADLGVTCAPWRYLQRNKAVRAIEGVGNDLVFRDRTAAPTVLIGKMVVAGA